MPIKPQLEWQDAESTVQITVKLPGIAQSQGQLDLQLTEVFLKINRAPYLCYVDLFDSVVDSKSTATLSSDSVEFCLVKVIFLPSALTDYLKPATVLLSEPEACCCIFAKLFACADREGSTPRTLPVQLWTCRAGPSELACRLGTTRKMESIGGRPAKA